MRFPDFAAVESYLNSLINYEHEMPLGGARDRPKLDPTMQAAKRLYLTLRLSHCVHIAGTKGKGSVVAFLEALLGGNEPLVLSFTSPHLLSVKERARLNGTPLDDVLWQEGFEAIASATEAEPRIRLSYFESVFIFFLWVAKRLGTGIHIVEAGLGGQWDATNILENTVAVMTLVDFDHTEILGKTITEIATDKSGIIKPSAQVIVGRQPPEAQRVYEVRIQSVNAHGILFGMDYRWTEERENTFRYDDPQQRVPGLRLTVTGDHQRDNAAVAIRTARLIRPELSAGTIRERVMNCTIPGRQQLLPGTPKVMLDVAHNPVSFRALADTLRRFHSGSRIVAVIGMMKDKDARASLEALQGVVSELLIVEVPNPRSYKRQDLADIAEALGFVVTCPDSLDVAFALLHQADVCDLGLVAGSFYLAGDYLLWRQRAGIA